MGLWKEAKVGILLGGAGVVLVFAGRLLTTFGAKLGPEAFTAGVVAQFVGLVLLVPGAIKLAFGYWRMRDRNAPPVPAANAILVTCPGCRQPTDSLKTFQLVSGTFFLIAAQVRTERYNVCPRCARRAIEENLLGNLTSANLLWIATALRAIGPLVSSFRRGHSKEIERQLRQPQLAG